MKLKRLFTMSILSLCLLTTSVAFSAANGTLEKGKTSLNQSTKVHDITFTINDYSINNNKLIVNYTVESKATHNTDKTISLIERPDIFIGDKLIHGDTESYKKINKNKYIGTAEATLPQDLSNKFAVKFNTDAILNQEGQWTIDFKVK